jgi:hypothetical protein
VPFMQLSEFGLGKPVTPLVRLDFDFGRHWTVKGLRTRAGYDPRLA